MYRKLLSIVALIIASLWLAACAGQSAPQSTTITFGFTPWTTTYPGTYIAKELIEEHYGHQVKLQDADVGVIYQGLGGGSIDVFMDNWHLLHADQMASQEGKVEDLGRIYGDAILGWGVPAYVDEGVQSISDLNQYRQLFDGKVVGIDPGAGMSRTSEEIISSYGLDYEYVASSEAAMLTAVDKAFKAQEPILFLVYRPHSMFVKYDIRVLEDPKGIWETDEVHVVANVELKDKAPEVYEMLKRFEIPIEDYEAWIAAQEDGANPEDLARQWIEEHPEEVAQILGRQ